jgi:hypothetical protein
MQKSSKITTFFILMMVLVTLAAHTAPVSASAITGSAVNNTATLEFPNTVTFEASLEESAAITSVVLEYGTEQLTCGEVIAKAFPQFTPAEKVKVEWTWDMRQSGSLPPGTTIWWRWRYNDANGKEYVTPEQKVTWLDDTHPWETKTDGLINVHWYENDDAFAQTMIEAAKTSLERNFKSAGLKPNKPINIYVYPNYDDLREAILYENNWVGGQAFPEHNIVIMGLSSSDSGWNTDTVIHELTHVLIGNLTFSCLSFVPQWLNEGLAVYSEGELAPQLKEPLDLAIKTNQLLVLRTLNGPFAEGRDQALLSYSQSFSVVKYLIDTYGQEKMNQLLLKLRDGYSTDDALMEIYNFDVDGLDNEWRASVGVPAHDNAAQPTAVAVPTQVPTIVPVSGAPLAITPTPYAVPTSSTMGGDTPSSNTGGPPLVLTLAVIGFCLLLLLIVGVIVLGLIVRSQNKKGGN